MNTATVSLCMIVRNEENFLRRCLSGAANFVDEIILVDTGSADRTEEIARQFGARVFKFQWNDDFAAARNYGLQQATGEWILVLDADEYLDEETAGKLHELTKCPYPPDIYLLPLKNLMSPQPGEYQTSLVLRLFKNQPDLRFSGKIHEQVLVSADKKVKIAENGPYIIHLGYLDKRRLEKNLRNMEMLKKALEAEPENPYHHSYISTEYILQKDYETALAHVRKALSQIPPDVVLFRTVCIRNAVLCLLELKQFDEALEILLSEIEANANFPDYHYYLGNVYREKGCFNEAVRHYSHALSVLNPSPAGCSMSGSNGYKSLYYRGLCQQKLRRYFDAIDSFKAALDDNPSFTVSLMALVKSLLLTRTPKDCLRFLEKNFDIVSPELCLLVGQVLFAEGFPDIAREYLAGSGDLEPSPKTAFFLGELALAGDKLSQAEKYFRKVPDKSSLYVSSLIFRCICSWKKFKPITKNIMSALRKAGNGTDITEFITYLDKAFYGNNSNIVHHRPCEDTETCLTLGRDLFDKLLELGMYRHSKVVYSWLTNTDPGIRRELVYKFKVKRGFLKTDVSLEPTPTHRPSFYTETAIIYETLAIDYLKRVPVLPERPLSDTVDLVGDFL